MIVMKFGGSSLESAAAVKRVVSIVQSSLEEHPVVVVSAMGKTTDRLARIAALSSDGEAGTALSELRELEIFHTTQLRLVTDDIGKPFAGMITLFDSAVDLVSRIAKAGTLSASDSDALLSHGEMLASIVVAAALESAAVPALHLHAEKLIVTDERHGKAVPLHGETYAKLRRAVLPGRVAVMGGFIGATENGAPSTLGRGGSDLTAALVGAALNAEEVQIWTDVNGMLSCDPRVLKGGRCLREISYAEATEMAEWGAKVLHPATVAPAMRQRVPVSIRNSRNAGHPGTAIVAAGTGKHDGLVKSIACRQTISLVRILPEGRQLNPQFVALVKNIFAAHGVDFLPVNARQGVEAAAVVNAELIADLSRAGKVMVERGLASVSLIGRGVGEHRGLISRAAGILAKRSIPFHAMGTAPIRVTFLVAEQELASATAGLHEEFVTFQESANFYPEFEGVRRYSRSSRLRFSSALTMSPTS